MKLISQFDQVIETIMILDPQEPIDAKTLAALMDCEPKQTSWALSKLHRTGYLAKVGTENRYALYVLTMKRLKKKGASIQKEYRNKLKRMNKQYDIEIKNKITKNVLKATEKALKRELDPLSKSSNQDRDSKQLLLFR
jgi:Mn-dependent DtxR family transcriptional regulator